MLILDGSFDRNIAYKAGKSISRVSIPVGTKVLLFSVIDVVQCNQPATMGNDAISQAQCLSLLLADWALSSGHRQMDLVVWKSVLLAHE